MMTTPPQMFRMMAIVFLPAWHLLCRKILRMMFRASVERSFSTLNRILIDGRNRLLPVHQDCLLRVSSEGPDILGCSFLEAMYAEWSKKPRRFVSDD
jgi:hypothetical protein